MTISYSLAPNPKWYIADLTGLPLGGGYLATFRSLDPQQIKLVYEDPDGNFPWPYVTIPNVGSLGILLDMNGSQGPFYFEFDSANPQETYYLEVYDSNGVLQWTIDDFTPSGGSGGSVITTAINLTNLITNNVMWRNIGITPISTSTFLKLAPGAHSDLTQTPANAGPDICFIKNNTSASDTIAFPKFNLGDNTFSPDETPVDYLEYVCTGTPTGETFKYVQFPITHGVQNLTNNAVAISIWGRVRSGNASILLQFFQFFGDGGGSLNQITPIQTLTFQNTWQKFTITTTVPDVSGTTIGSCGNDGLFLQVQFALDAACTIDFTKPSLYLGNLTPQTDYLIYDIIDAVINSPRTGYIYSGYDLTALPGYLRMDDGTIGSAASGATSNAGLGANINTFPLYNLLWNSVSQPSSNVYASVTGGLGASAVADFSANKSMQLPLALSRAMACAGQGSGFSNYLLGGNLGLENATLLIANMPSHAHPGSTIPTTVMGTGGNIAAVGSNNGALNAVPANIAAQGTATPFLIIQPTMYTNYFIKL